MPSRTMNTMAGEPFFRAYPFTMLLKLQQTEQSPLHHPEGSVWNHTMLVLDYAAKVKTQSKDPQALLWAALLHDIGKPETTKTRNGEITAYNHEKLGTALARDFLNELIDDAAFIEKVVSLVRWHMQILYVVNRLPFADVPTMRCQADATEVAILGFCDRMGRTNADLQQEEKNIVHFLQECAQKE
ncbi:MAG: HDIG domain-containing metalloprotein [Christensenellales bacterium]